MQSWIHVVRCGDAANHAQTTPTTKSRLPGGVTTHPCDNMAEYLASIFGTEKDKWASQCPAGASPLHIPFRVNCSFYFKIGACRHGERCSRLHNKPTFSQVGETLQVNPNFPTTTTSRPSSFRICTRTLTTRPRTPAALWVSHTHILKLLPLATPTSRQPRGWAVSLWGILWRRFRWVRREGKFAFIVFVHPPPPPLLVWSHWKDECMW